MAGVYVAPPNLTDFATRSRERKTSAGAIGNSSQSHRVRVSSRWDLRRDKPGMLAGYVDRISHGDIAGWAADKERPDETVKVSIFVDEYKRAQLACDLARPDLRQSGQWGDGRHGFRFRFPATLAREVTHRVSVRFTATGRALNEGEVMLSPDGTTALPVRNRPNGRNALAARAGDAAGHLPAISVLRSELWSVRSARAARLHRPPAARRLLCGVRRVAHPRRSQ